MSYIYKITNLFNGKVYIGQTSLTPEQRFKEHLHDSKGLYKERRPLYEAIKKYGEENFEVSTIEECEPNKANEREAYWIQTLRSYIGYDDCNGYNATLGGDSRYLYDYSEIAEKFKELQNVKLTAKYFNCDSLTVRKACKAFGLDSTIGHKNQCKAVQRTNIDGTDIHVYASVSEASHDIPGKIPETARKNISRALNRGNIAYNFLWKYI